MFGWPPRWCRISTSLCTSSMSSFDLRWAHTVHVAPYVLHALLLLLHRRRSSVWLLQHDILARYVDRQEDRRLTAACAWRWTCRHISRRSQFLHTCASRQTGLAPGPCPTCTAPSVPVAVQDSVSLPTSMPEDNRNSTGCTTGVSWQVGSAASASPRCWCCSEPVHECHRP